jgi:hypothetical protein
MGITHGATGAATADENASVTATTDYDYDDDHDDDFQTRHYCATGTNATTLSLRPAESRWAYVCP